MPEARLLVLLIVEGLGLCMCRIHVLAMYTTQKCSRGPPLLYPYRPIKHIIYGLFQHENGVILTYKQVIYGLFQDENDMFIANRQNRSFYGLFQHEKGVVRGAL